MNKQMIPFNLTNLKYDCKKSFNRMYKNKYKSISAVLIVNGWSSSTFANAKRNYVNDRLGVNKAAVDAEYKTDGIVDDIGLISSRVYESILQIFDLDDIYRISKRSDTIPTIEELVESSETQVVDMTALADAMYSLNKTLSDISTSIRLIKEKLYSQS